MSPALHGEAPRATAGTRPSRAALRSCGALLLAVGLLAGCNGAVSDAMAEPAREVRTIHRVPQRSELVCFPCHSQIKFEKGPPFAHASAGHRGAGHCHACHVGKGHEPRQIDREACLTCHEERAAALKILSKSGRKSN